MNQRDQPNLEVDQTRAEQAGDENVADKDPLEQAKDKAKEAIDRVKKAADDLSDQKVGAKIGNVPG